MRTTRRVVPIAVIVALGLAASAWAGSVSAAKSRVAQARELAEKNQKDDATDKLAEAEKFLDGLTDAEKGPIAKDIAAVREKLAGTVDPEVSGRIERNVGRLLTMAEGDVNANPHNAAEGVAHAVAALDADDAKKNLSPVARKALQARVDALQAKVKGGNATADAKRFADRVERNLRAASENADNDATFARTRLDEATALLASDEAKQTLDAATIGQLRGGGGQPVEV